MIFAPEPGLFPPDTSYRVIDTLQGPIYVSELQAGDPGLMPPDTSYRILNTPEGPVYYSESGAVLPFVASDGLPSGVPPAAAPTAPSAINWGTLALIGLGAWLLLRR